MPWRALLLASLFAPTLAAAQFHDQGMSRTPAVKTEYVNPEMGTAAAPLVIGTCLWGDCRAERLVFAQSNHWQQNLACDPCNGPVLPGAYWSVLFNNEPRADPGNSGPPDASLPRAPLGQGLMGFATLRGTDNPDDDTRWRAHLLLDLIGFPNPVFGGIPFLGFGEFSDRGNLRRTLAYLNPGARSHPSRLSFGARLWQAVPPVPISSTQPATLAAYVWIVANWGTKPKAIFITLYHFNLQNSVPPGEPAVNHFSWPITESALYPGAEIVYIDAEDMRFYCGFDTPSLALQQDVAYDINLTALFGCASKRNLFTEPMPQSADIPVTQVLWANESSGADGDLWIDVHDQKMLTASDAPEPSPPASALPGPALADVLAGIERRCAAIAGCAARAAALATGHADALELPVARQPSRPMLLRAAGNGAKDAQNTSTAAGTPALSPPPQGM